MPYFFELHFPKCYISYLTPMVTYIYASCCQRHNVDTDAADPMGQTAVRHRKLSLWYFSVTWYPLLLAEIGWKNPSQLNLGLFWSCHIKICAIQTWCTMAMKAWNDKKIYMYPVWEYSQQRISGFAEKSSNMATWLQSIRIHSNM